MIQSPSTIFPFINLFNSSTRETVKQGLDNQPYHLTQTFTVNLLRFVLGVCVVRGTFVYLQSIRASDKCGFPLQLARNSDIFPWLTSSYILAIHGRLCGLAKWSSSGSFFFALNILLWLLPQGLCTCYLNYLITYGSVFVIQISAQEIFPQRV